MGEPAHEAHSADEPAGWEAVVSSIGPKVRALRLSAGLTLQQLARAADVSTASVHKVERGDMVPTITTLLKIARALGTPIRYFVEEGDTEPLAVHTRFGEAIADGPVVLTGSAERFRALGTAARLAPGERRPGLRRPGELLVVVLAGEIEVTLGARSYTLGADQSLHFATDVEHELRNTGDEPADVVAVDVPAN
ncbi:transcriptional regulator, XRE family with cupin sensor [Pseudonocardia thermophila]|mgnify:CR=1 FL=1|jgi:Predicted transcriptional regulators|uniref:Transcriptional regulator, XRE family with cupin sensor n=1 Tax=Pseudonocardia thermophila TaxID=1848 RepID=A0A1M6XDR3_PSETH|nr:XRE family transcriptional regulator [Pseudonocardia thermophila]SHL03989.1 transcriptional regulator, XRE family with cupin sensor [Pseudonocardia thermophila]